ncbi:iduronate 2-sulfatase-like [Mya arenaria]|uniref:iduronate 2-sulfatase-like n=1 Tax=Mya arenaria TaxID=6604 RepID=UPI0022E199B7|nr:iduronate 2-sulfatase-like [Mya arenaria]
MNRAHTLLFLLYGFFLQCGARKNVLFIIVDDLRPDLGCFRGADFPTHDDPPPHTPHMDALAGSSLLVRRAYVQQAVCSPSRTSFLTGRRPDTTRVYDLETHFRSAGGNFTTLPQYFRNHGRRSIGIGKIFHQGIKDPLSWSEPDIYPGSSNWDRQNASWQFVPDNLLHANPLIDYKIAQSATKKLGEFATGGKYAHTPFFLAVGFIRPHLPFVSPASFGDLYPLNTLKLPSNNKAPVGMPEVAWFKSNEIRTQYEDIHRSSFTGEINNTIPNNIALDLRRAYYSAVSWVDSQVGVVLDELNRLGLADSTVISLVGDHGWQLGEHGIWGKSTNFELATHAPMILKIPGLTDSGLSTRRIVEFVDLFPTLVEAVGLPKVSICPENSAHVSTCTEGESFMPLVHNTSADWKHVAFSQYQRHQHRTNIMGYSLRTERYRYTEWPEFSYQTFKPDWTKLHGVELYDHTVDPDENHNRADDTAYATLRANLSWRLHAGWRHASPSLHQAGPALVG